MVLAQIIRLALRQLDEDAADAAEYEEMFTLYANAGYQIMMKQYMHEKEDIPMLSAGDTPRLPETAHAALADYICYRHLMTGSLAKQARAEAFHQSFLAQSRMLRPKNGEAGVMHGLYTATDIRRG